MEKFFENNVYVLFALVIYYLLISDKPKIINQKIVVIYFFIVMLSMLKILDLKFMLLIVLICLFIYFEFLIDDKYKTKIIRRLLFKIIDFSYLIIIKYNFLGYVFSLLFISNFFTTNIKLPSYINFVIFIFLFMLVIINITNSDFELYSFTEVYDKLNEINFGNFKKLDKNKIKILITIEDKSFFERKNDYTFLCWDFIKYRLHRINEVITRVEAGKHYKHKLSHIYKFLIYVVKQLFRQIIDIKNYKIRGYSTIDMQLLRIIFVKDGYEKVFMRKNIEFIYSQLFFKGLKKYYKLNYKEVSSNYFKNFILVNYVKYATLFFNGKVFKLEELWGKDVDKINDSEFFLSVLCLSGRLKYKNLNFKNIKNRYREYLGFFNLDSNQLKYAIKKMKKCKAI